LLSSAASQTNRSRRTGLGQQQPGHLGSAHRHRASDPHLPSQLPSVFYRAHLTGGDLNAIGATAVGIPGVIMGHHGRIAWGWTNAMADVQDLFMERIRDGAAEYDGRLEPLQVRQEIIRVKGAADVLLSVRSSRHGPLVSDLIDPSGPALALRWATLDTDDDIGIAAYLEMNKARNWSEFTGAFRRFKAHGQNLVYADTAGNIAYLMAGSSRFARPAMAACRRRAGPPRMVGPVTSRSTRCRSHSTRCKAILPPPTIASRRICTAMPLARGSLRHTAPRGSSK
jgi:hypothetical protein